ncbi:hypothetical protein IMG5_177050 [Ichthyophthirius multifiliis]|uniref:Serine aminopeptidase S33 domain-containing protein n=1 Tax=Ichthyophthirius multifiliis TaxID=5932 RepID=G0R2D9_ICHMU|nr:hypothetical protein IMG5_177050 [Ichthyophthirius multifiliis]EGR28358.1 hypothetical protein IMG5_177050 [Ichthyophthirius multifiliis]|eukprot:XP_004027703.1 hypothetical protein IMG5_177050 [Ichthyophthirius multifiliis]
MVLFYQIIHIQKQELIILQNKKRNLNYEDVQIKTLDQITLRGWLIKQENSNEKPTVVFFHENAGNIGHRLYYLKNYFENVKVNILIIAYRGYSNSDEVQQINEQGLQIDSKAIIQYAFKCPQIDKNKIFLHGRSLGAAALCYGVLNTNKQPKGIILENTFTSIDDMVEIIAKPLAQFSKFILKNNWKTIDIIQNIKNPSLFIKTKKDEIIPSKQMDYLYEKCGSENKILFEIQEGQHNDSWKIDQNLYFSQIKKFIEQNC